MVGAGSRHAPASSTIDRTGISLPFRPKPAPTPRSSKPTYQVDNLPFRFKTLPARHEVPPTSTAAIHATLHGITPPAPGDRHAVPTGPEISSGSINAVLPDDSHSTPVTRETTSAATRLKMLKAYDPLLPGQRLSNRNYEPSRGRSVRQKVLTSTSKCKERTQGLQGRGNKSTVSQAKFFDDRDSPSTDVEDENTEGINSDDLDTVAEARFNETLQKRFATHQPPKEAPPVATALTSPDPASLIAFPSYLCVPGVLQPSDGKPENKIPKQSSNPAAQNCHPLPATAPTSKVRRFQHTFSQRKPYSGQKTSRVELVRGSTCLFIMEMAAVRGASPDEIMETMQYECMDEIMLIECGWNAGDVEAVLKECERLGLNAEIELEADLWGAGGRSSQTTGRDSGLGFAAAGYSSEEEDEEEEEDSDSEWDCEPIDEAVTGSKVVVEGWWCEIEDSANRDWVRHRSPDIGPLGGNLRRVPRSAAAMTADDVHSSG